MTHLFIDLNQRNYQQPSNGESKVINVTRTGKPVILIYLGISEPETTFRAMNEMLYLLTLPSLDDVFRNGHGEDPDSKLTQMCMVRILCLLHLTKLHKEALPKGTANEILWRGYMLLKTRPFLGMEHLAARKFTLMQIRTAKKIWKTWRQWLARSWIVCPLHVLEVGIRSASEGSKKRFLMMRID